MHMLALNTYNYCLAMSATHYHVLTWTHTHTHTHTHIHTHGTLTYTVRTSSDLNETCISSFYPGQPSVKLLTCFPSKVDGEKKMINIIQKTGTSYEKLGMFLLEDDNGDIVDSLKEACHHDPIQITTAVYKKWISGTGMKPVTWQTLVGVLRDIELNRVADDINSTINPLK